MIQLSDHFNFKRLLRFTLPSIIMLVFSSIYGVVDGFFVSNYTGKTSFAAVNFIMPFLMILGSVGFMFGTGGGALIAKTIGEGNSEKAKGIFSMLIWVSTLFGIILGILGIAFIRPIAAALGAEGKLLDDCVTYGRIILISLPFFILQYEFQCLFATAEKPKLGLYVTVAAGVTNMVLDALFVAVFSWGLVGAAVATAFSQIVGGMIPLLYFARKNNSRLKLVRFKMDVKSLLKSCANGSSELMSNISISFVSMLYNVQLMNYAGENGVAAYGVLMYVGMIFQSIFIGYSVGTAPITGYNYGAGNKDELKNLLRINLIVIGIFSIAMFAAGELFGGFLSELFVGYDQDLLDITRHAFSVFSISFIFCGFAIFGSSFFTALNDGLTSALISFLRTMIFQTAAVLILPALWELEGVWWSIVVAEVVAVAVTVVLLFAKRKKYGYA